MGKGSANPVEQWRKKEKKKLQKKHTEDKIKTKAALLMQKEPDQILADIRRIQWAERQGIADPKMLAQKRRLLEIHKNVSEKKQLEMERREKEKSVVVKGLTKLLGRSTSKASASDSNNKFDQELQELVKEDPSARANDDGILAAPPNLAPPRMPAPAPWATAEPTEVWQPYGPPLPLPGVHQRPPAPPAYVPPPQRPVQRVQGPVETGTVLESSPSIRKNNIELCTEFLPTNMLLNARRRSEAAPAKRRKPVVTARPAVKSVPSQSLESAESAYNSFLSEIGE